MNRNLLTVLNWKKSIRGRIMWSTMLTFVLALVGTYLIEKVVNYFIGSQNSFGFFMYLVLLFFFYFVFMLPIVRYLRTLAEGIMSIAKGDLHSRIPASREDELGTIARNINYMAEQLQGMMERERRVETSKMELITHVSHDLRTPLTSIIGYLNLLKTDNYRDMAEHRRYIENAFQKSQQLKKLIDDLFEYTRLTSGDVYLALRTVDLNGLLEQLVNEFEPIAQDHSLTVRHSGEQRPVFGHVDAEKFVRAIDNLLMNALKFSRKPGEITVRLVEQSNRIVISVENWGKPIDRDQEQLLFERFYKAEPSRNDLEIPSGAGLGLSIAKNIVELHGGRIGLDHQQGHFTFYIELPHDSGAESETEGEHAYDERNGTKQNF